ncbi:MAG TPA: D-2-hydroxyacid dehydrogenase [Gammaproteobacteria bacterium]
MRIVVHLEHEVPAFTPSPRQAEALRQALAAHDVRICRDRDAFFEGLPAAEAAVVWEFAPEWYERAPALRHVFTPAAGRERVAADPRGRVVPTYGTFHGRIMAESLLAMIGFVSRRFGAALDAQRRHAWDRAPYLRLARLAGQTVLIVGYGHIGRHCGRLLKAVGMRVHALKRDVSVGTEGADRVFAPAELHAALPHADHVVCILPGDTGTDGLIDREAFARMKPGAAVYNIGRGNAIDAGALEEALRAGRIAAAFLDVLPEEPLPPGSPLWSVPNLIITPHVSALTADYLDLYFEELVPLLERCATERAPVRD